MEAEALAKWQASFVDNERATPFARPEWILAFRPESEWFEPLKYGFAPLDLTIRKGTRTVRLLGADYEDVISQKGQEEDVVVELLERLRSRRSSWDICDFHGLLPQSILLSQFQNRSRRIRAALKGMSCAMMPHQTYFRVRLPASYEEYEVHLGKKLAYQMRAAEGRRQRSFKSTELRMATVETLARDVEALMNLHSARWQEQGLPGIFPDEPSRERFRGICRSFMALRQLRLYTLWLDQEPASALFTLADARRIYYYTSGFNRAFQKHHPVKVLLARAIQDGIAGGFEVFDFMKGTEDYKASWANDCLQTQRLIIANNTPAGLAALFAFKVQSGYKNTRRSQSMVPRLGS